MDSTVLKTANAERFINLRQQKKVKEFLVKQRGYKRPDFNRIILDLSRLKWTHEKIAFVLPVAVPRLFQSGREVELQTLNTAKL